jgi:hypothetical protein
LFLAHSQQKEQLVPPSKEYAMRSLSVFTTLILVIVTAISASASGILFGTGRDYAAGKGPLGVFCADLDGDGYLDLAVANWNADYVSILKNNGNGTYQSAVNYVTGGGSNSVFCADLDGDTDLDIAVANREGGSVSVLENNGDGTFQSPVNFWTGSGSNSVFCADLDTDGDLDLAVANLGNTPGSGYVSILNNLSDIPVAQILSSFSLLFPPNKAFTPRGVKFDWEIPFNPNPFSQVRYDLYLSTSYQFPDDSTIVDSDLVVSEHRDTLDYGTYYWKVKAKDNWGAERWCSQASYFMVTGIHYSSGDFNGDGEVNSGDVVYAINYLFRNGPEPDLPEAGDCNCDDSVGPGDVVFLINYLFKGGLPPSC